MRVLIPVNPELPHSNPSSSPGGYKISSSPSQYGRSVKVKVKVGLRQSEKNRVIEPKDLEMEERSDHLLRSVKNDNALF